MLDIVIDKPRLNEMGIFASYSHNDSLISHALDTQRQKAGITPHDFPRAVDLCAGDGSLARYLVDRGWDPKNITCIDQVDPEIL